MKLNKYQKHYNQYFKDNRKITKSLYPNQQIKTNKIYWYHTYHKSAKFNTLSNKLMRSIGLVISGSVYTECSSSSINPKKVIDGLYLKEINSNVYYIWESEFSRFDAFISIDIPILVMWEDIFLDGLSYKLSSIAQNSNIVPEFSTTDFSKEFTEEFLFQHSVLSTVDLVEWQRIYKVLKVLNSTTKPLTIARIYENFIK